MKGKLKNCYTNNSKILWITFLLYIFIQTFSHGFYSFYFLNYVKIPLSTYSSAKGLWFVCVLLLQIPSGYLADKYSKKMLLLTSLVSMLVAFILYELSVQNCNNFYFAEIFSGISTALGTGTIELLLIEKIKKSHILVKLNLLVRSCNY